jgi:ubiquinone/menaquinone biosynthesis C-methylase UbiE
MATSSMDRGIPRDSNALALEKRGLTASDFCQIAKNGFGDRYNAYPHSMAWFRDHLYVGTSRNNFVMIKVTIDDGMRKANLPIWPVEKPENLQEILHTLASEIWRYDPRADRWSRVHVSPLVKAPTGYEVPESVAYRVMTVFQGASDPAPALYVPTRPSSHTGSTVLLRSLDGENFEAVSEPGMGLPTKPKGIRGFQEYKGRLFAAPAESGIRGRGNVANVMQIVVSDDPARGNWREACEPGFSDPTNRTAFDLEVFNGYLYAGTVNIEEGFQIWKTDAEGEPPYRWTRVLSRGAHRGPLNQIAQTLCSFEDHLYVGTAIQGLRDHENNVGPAPFELIRIGRDDSWELVCGEPRRTPDGLKVPLSGLGAGLGCQTPGYLWMMCAHDGWLYAGDAGWAILLRYSDRRAWPPVLRANLTEDMVESMVRDYGGFNLWRTRDGVEWTPVTHNGFGNHYNMGCRTMLSTEHGLFVGGINPFGPKVAVERVGGWRYEFNRDSGLEIWLGNRSHSPQASPSRAMEWDERDGEPSWLDAAQDFPEDPEELVEPLVHRFYGDSDFRNCGYWSGATRTAREACENLMEETLSLLANREGTILDVGCGEGATARYLSNHFEADRIVAVTERKHLAHCRRSSPEISFRAMKLPRIQLPSESVDKALCIEGAGLDGWSTTLWFEMHRVLRRGGQVVGSDFLYFDEPAQKGGITSKAPALLTAEDYRERLEELGFTEVRVLDCSERCWGRFSLHRAQYLAARLHAFGFDGPFHKRVMQSLPGGRRPVLGYLLISAFKEGKVPDSAFSRRNSVPGG